jgi:hypothetical protein
MWRAVIGIALVALAGNIDQAAAQAPPGTVPLQPQAPPGTVPRPHFPELQQFFVTTGKLVRVGTGWASEGFYLTLDVDTANNNCKSKSSLFIDRGHPQYRETVSIALLSLAQARPIDVYHDGSCYGDVVKLFAVSIHTTP